MVRVSQTLFLRSFAQITIENDCENSRLGSEFMNTSPFAEMILKHIDVNDLKTEVYGITFKCMEL